MKFLGNKLKDYQKIVYEMFYDHVYRTIYFIVKDHYTAEDLVQETFLKVFNKIGSLEDSTKIKGWISTIASRTAIDFIRKQKRQNSFPTDNVLLDSIDFSYKETASSIETKVENNLKIEYLESQISNLSDQDRQLLLLKYVHELTYQDIGNIFDIKEGTVKSKLFRVKNNLKKIMDLWNRGE